MLQKEQRVKERENEAFRRKNKDIVDLAQRDAEDLIQEKRKLEVDVSNLEGHLKVVRESVTKATAAMAEKRALMNDIMQLDSQNQGKREQIMALMKRVASLKDEIQILEETTTP